MGGFRERWSADICIQLGCGERPRPAGQPQEPQGWTSPRGFVCEKRGPPGHNLRDRPRRGRQRRGPGTSGRVARGIGGERLVPQGTVSVKTEKGHWVS